MGHSRGYVDGKEKSYKSNSQSSFEETVDVTLKHLYFAFKQLQFTYECEQNYCRKHSLQISQKLFTVINKCTSFVRFIKMVETRIGSILMNNWYIYNKNMEYMCFRI